MEPDVRIDPALLTVFPQIRLGCLSYEAAVAPSSPALWSVVEQETVPAVLAELEEKALAGIEGIRCSREAYKAFGRSPSRYRVSSESLIRRIRQGNPLYHVNTVVDVNNLSRLRGPITLTVGQAGEGYEGIGKSYIDMEHMLLLRDEEGPFGSPTSDSHRAMIGPESTRILTVTYCFSDTIDLDAALERAAGQLSDFAGAAQIRRWIVR